jgi:hypothetical protein
VQLLLLALRPFEYFWKRRLLFGLRPATVVGRRAQYFAHIHLAGPDDFFELTLLNAARLLGR